MCLVLLGIGLFFTAWFFVYEVTFSVTCYLPVAHPLVVGEAIGSNLGLTPSLKIFPTAAMTGARY